MQSPDEISSLSKAHIHESLTYLPVSDKINFGSVSKRMHAFFQEKHLLDIFLQRVAYGMQDKVEQLFSSVYSGHPAKIQEALRYQGQFTDYSGRSFHCSAYEYAYWAKDTHMCRMLEPYMDEETKANLLARINENEASGLCYQQNGEEHRSAHFDFTPLKEAYQRYLTGYEAWYAARNWDAIDTALLAVGKAQRNVPAHVAQEYCRPDGSFSPMSEFNEETLPGVLTFYNSVTGQNEAWFPLAAPSSGLGFHFTLLRWPGLGCLLSCMGPGLPWPEPYLIHMNEAAVTRLDVVRTAQLTLSREYLQSPATSHSFSS